MRSEGGRCSFGRRLRRVGMHAVLVFALGAGHAGAADWWNFDRNEALRRMRAAVDKMEAVVPIPSLQCGKPGTLLRCKAEIRPGLMFFLTLTAAGAGADAFAAFHAGRSEGTYELGAELTALADDTAWSQFQTLCVASYMAARPAATLIDAQRRVDSLLRSAANKSGDGRGEAQHSDKISTFFLSVWKGRAIICTASAEDDYLR